MERVRRNSLYGQLPRWALRAVIVKSGDDCRQEHMAVQIISSLHAIFLEAGLPLWLRPFEARRPRLLAPRSCCPTMLAAQA